MKKFLLLTALALLLSAISAYAADPQIPVPDALEAPAEPAPSLGPPTTEKLSEPVAPGASKEAIAPSPIASPATVMPAPVANAPASNADIPESELSNADLLRERLNKEKEKRDSHSLSQRRELVKHEAAPNHVELDYVMNGFNKFNFNPSVKGNPIFRSSKGVALEWMFFPISHGFGRFGLGPAVGAYEAKSDATLSGLSPDFYTIGLKATFQLQLFVNQPFVPFAVAGIDYVKQNPFINDLVTKANPGDGNQNQGTQISGSSFNTPYYGFGLGLNLNPLEYRAAEESMAANGVRKYFIVYTFVHRQSSDVNHSGDSHFLGLRFEY